MEILQLKRMILGTLLEMISNTDGDKVTIDKMLLWNITMATLQDTYDFEELQNNYNLLAMGTDVNKEMMN